MPISRVVANKGVASVAAVVARRPTAAAAAAHVLVAVMSPIAPTLTVLAWGVGLVAVRPPLADAPRVLPWTEPFLIAPLPL